MSVNSDFAIAQQTTKPSKALNLTIWGIQILTALAFLAAGGSKLSSAPAMVDMFEKIGLGQWFRYVTGSFEVIGAVLLVLPRTAAIGGWLLAAVMIGANRHASFHHRRQSHSSNRPALAGNHGRLESIETVRNAATSDGQCRAFSFGIGVWSG